MTKENLSKAPSGRPKRIPVGSRPRLHVINKDPNYVYRVVNDENGRVQIFQQAGYEVVNAAEHSLQNLRVEGRATDNVIPVGGGTNGVLMRIPKEFYEEDQAAKEKALREREMAILSPKIDGAYGKISLEKEAS